MSTNIMFILKRREIVDQQLGVYSSSMLNSGLYNSARFVADMLRPHVEAVTLYQVIDNNDIDALVTLHRPSHVVIEAYWVVPEKFEVLQKLHPTVQWIIRNHSEMSFLATEGIAMAWSIDYLRHANVAISCNSPRGLEDMRTVIRSSDLMMMEQEIIERVIYLPNYYPIEPQPARITTHKDYVDIACFGAIRPLKNHLVQAIAAMQYAEDRGQDLRFHINATRVEGNGEPILKNLREMFARTNHELVEHGWLKHQDFMALVRTMDLGMQVSFTESFNIVTADLVSCHVPVVTSPEIFWCHASSHANPTSSASMVERMHALSECSWILNLVKPNLRGLVKYNKKSQRAWLKYFS